MDAIIDLRSDTVTRPTPAMRKAMAEAEVGDDVARDDPTVNRLEALAAEFMGKEAALYVPSGTMGNVCAVLSVTRPGDAMVCDLYCHSAQYEGGAPAALGGVTVTPVRVGKDGVLRPEHIRSAINPDDIHCSQTRLVVMENTNNRAGGTCVSLMDTGAVSEVCRELGLWFHLDGARVCNSAVAQGVTPRELAASADSVMFCLSKGLCAPVGSLLAGDREFVDRARRKRKMLGGGMRQAGVLAAAGIVALTTMVDRLAEDHEKARRLGEALAAHPKLEVDLDTVQTNMVYFALRSARTSLTDLASALKDRGVLCYATAGRIRLVTHHDVPAELIPVAVEQITACADMLL